MKRLISMTVTLVGMATVAHANAGMAFKNCFTETVVDTVLAETPWMMELTQQDPTFRYMIANGLLEGMANLTDQEWADAAAEDLSFLRKVPAEMIVERWIYDAMAKCSQPTY